MATRLYLRNTQTLITGYYDLLPTAGAAIDTCSTTTVAGTTQMTKTAGGSTVAWISQAIGTGLTLTTSDIALWLASSAASIYCNYRVFKYSGGTETELGGGPFQDDATISNRGDREDTWTGNFTDTAFARGDRLVLKLYVVDAAGGATVTAKFNAADASTGDSFFNINETITFLSRKFIVNSFG